MRYRGWRARPKISFALATAMLFVMAGFLTGLIDFRFDTAVLENTAALAVFIMAGVAALLLYEW